VSHLLRRDSGAHRSSLSRELTGRVADAWRAAHPDGGYTYRDLAADPGPLIDEAWTEICHALPAGGITDPARCVEVVRTSRQCTAWAVVDPLLAAARWARSCSASW
jgi:FMN-dependent NADH-azoreductase